VNNPGNGDFQLDIGTWLTDISASNEWAEIWIDDIVVTMPKYEIDLEVQWTNVEYSGTDEKLCIYAGDLGDEDIRVDYWNGSGWNNLFADLTPYSWNNISVSLISPTFTIRFKGGSETSDAIKDTWQIDTALLCLWIAPLSRADSSSANQWYYKWWGLQKIYVENGTGTYEITANSSSEGILYYYDNDWNLEDDTVINDWSGYIKYNVTDFKLTDYEKNLEYQDYILVEYIVLLCTPSGSFKFDNNSTATAANDPDKYGGVEYWLLNKQGNLYRNYITSNSTITVNY